MMNINREVVFVKCKHQKKAKITKKKGPDFISDFPPFPPENSGREIFNTIVTPDEPLLRP